MAKTKKIQLTEEEIYLQNTDREIKELEEDLTNYNYGHKSKSRGVFSWCGQ